MKTPKTQPPSPLAEAPCSEIPAHELDHLASVWRDHAAKCDGDLKLALESCAMDLARLRESYSPNDERIRGEADA
jgi:hypothetical protein